VRPAYFIPTFSKNANLICGGAEVHVIDPSAFPSVTVALHMIKAYLKSSNGTVTVNSGIDKLFGVVGFFQNIQTKEVSDILKDCEVERELYAAEVRKIYFYDYPSHEGEVGVKEKTSDSLRMMR
jgi:uncharacterized protein YbbC (DUF1343 family)